MDKIMKIFALVSTILTILFVVLFYSFNYNIFYVLAITSGTTAYHFTMRLFVGYSINYFLDNKVNYNRKWFKVSDFEMKLYQILKVKKWKAKMPTYAPETFDLTKHSLDEILMTMCQAEMVHEVIIVLSFVPLIAIFWLGSPLAFIITSVLSALFDLMFVIMQRFNRNRILRLKIKL